MKNLYTAFLCILVMCSAITQSQAKSFSSITGNTIGSDQTICNATTPAPLTGSTPGGGIGVYSYQWQVSSTSAIAGFTSIAAPGGTTQGYSPGALTANRWYRRIVTSGIEFDTTAAVTITVTPIITTSSNVITGTQAICYNTFPALLSGPTATGGNGTYNYQWQSSPDNVVYTNIPGANSTTYSPPALTATTLYKRVVTSGGCTSTSSAVLVSVTPVITAGTNTISANQSICSSQTPLPFSGSTPTGGTSAYTYLWESSTTSATSGFTTATGTSNAKTYSPASLTQSTWFHRIVKSGGCADTSATVLVTVVFTPPGNPAAYGNGVWNVYGYSDNAFGTYAGYYIEPVLSLNTTTRYPSSQSPSSASGYQGCQIPTTNFSVSLKQTNFTPASYQINIDSLDDNLNIFLNGTQIYAKTCCVTGGPINNVWTGNLGASDQVELRWVQATGPSFLNLQFQPVTPAPLVPGSIAQNLQVCYGEVPPSGFTNTASPTSGCSNITLQWQKSIDSVTWAPIPGATALTYTETSALTQTTWYRRVASDACNNVLPTATVKVTVNVVAPGDPTVYGNNTWNVYVFQGTGTPGAFSAAIYKGYYTEPLLSFNSTNRWANTASPSNASNYQGCVVNVNNTWISYKRTNFTPAIYQIDIPYHDDYAYLYINGILVFSHLGCCDSHTNVWTGPLGASDQVEYRVNQGGGPSSEALTLTAVTPPALTSGSITPSQTICAGNVPPTPFTESVAPTGGCTISGYSWASSTDNGTTWNTISGATAISYTATSSVYSQTLFRRTVYDVCGNSASSIPDTVYMNNTAPGNPAVFGNSTWNVYCFQDVNYSIYAGYYTEPLLTFATTNRYLSTSPPSTASGYQGCQLINTYYSVSMKRTNFPAGLYQIDVTADDDYVSIYINGTLVSSLTYPTIQNNVWTGNLGASDQIEVRWRNNAGPGQAGVRFTMVTATPLAPGSIVAYNPNLCYNDLPIINEVTPASGGCYANYSWQSSIDGGTTWTTISGATGNNFTATVSPTTNIQYRRVATDICGDTAYTSPVNFTQTAGTVGNPSVYGNGVWNVYAYDANGAAFSAAQYLGYYVEPLLSFNSLNRWSATGAPSDASGYQGCQVDQDNHWVSYRQTNFTPATYQIDVPYHDDDAYLFINGVQVWSQTGCCVSSTNVWTGTLGATDKVEFRWREYYGSSSGAVNFTVVNPTTTVTPGTIAASQIICGNTTPVAFTSTLDASSSCSISYQWQSSPDSATWTNISGATSNVYTPGAVSAKTYFQRVAINSCGVSAISNVVVINVYPAALTGGTVAANQTICKGTSAGVVTSTSLPTGGDGNYVYVWQSSLDSIGWSTLTFATGASYAPGSVTATTYFRRMVTACGASSSAYSNPVLITVNTLPVIKTQPANPTGCAGSGTSISVVATGTGLTYQWQVNTGSGFANVTNTAPYSGATTATLTINPITTGMTGYKYQVIVSGTCTPAVTSTAVTLAVSANAAITNQPVNTTVCAGSNASFTVNASGSGLTYQWQILIASTWTNLTDNATYSGSLTNALTITAVTTAMSSNNYRCVLNTTCPGVMNSTAGVLTVVAAPVNTINANQTVCSGINASNLTGSAASSYLWLSSTVSPTSGYVTASGTSNASGYTVPNPVTATTYYLRVAGNGTCTDTSNLVTIALNNTPITITAQPVAQAICANGTATFTATASGPGTLAYLWYENGVAMADGGIYSGTATNTLTITGATAGMNNYSYVLRVFASGCSTSFKNTSAAILTTNNGPVVTTSAPSLTTCQGSAVQLNITATGIGLTYQWQVNTGSGWNNLSNFGSYSNVNGTGLVINPALASMDGYKYQCVVTGTCSPFTATSATTTMNVNAPVANNSIANSQTLCAGTPAPFTGSTPTGGTGTYTYQWYLNTGSGWFAISGATTINYSSGPLTQTTQFLRQVTSGACASLNSTAITVTILPPTSTTNPINTTTCAGTSTTFNVVASGSGLSYQWQVNTGSSWSNVINGASYTGVTTATLTVVTPPYSFNNYQYRVIVGGGCAPISVTSGAATLTVSPVATITSQPSNVNTCAGSNAVYTVSATGSGLSYQWMEKTSSGVFTNTTDGGIYSGSQTATLTLSGVTVAMNNNQYQCVITIGSCPITSLIASLTVSAQPSLVITNPPTTCAPGTVDITAPAVTAGSTLAGGTLTYWNNITFTSPVTNPTAISVAGTYYIRVATSAVCYDIKPVVVSITSTLTNNNISASQAICTGSTPVALTGTAPGGGTGVYTYQWQQSTDNVTYTNITGATSTGYSPGALTVTTWYKRVVNSGTCSSTSSSVQISVVAYPTAMISYSGSPFCATATVAVTQSGQGGGTYSAPSGLSINASTGTINLGASVAGTYTVTYSFSNGTCNGSTTTSVTITALPTATISYPGSPYCATGTATPTQTGTTGGTYSAAAGLSINASTGAVNLATSTLGTYMVTYVFSSGSCSNSTTATIVINALPTAAIAYNGSPYCATGIASVTQSGPTGGTYTAPAGVVINSSTGAINLVTSAAGTYLVTYSFSSGACSNTTTASITINALPTATIAYGGSPYCGTGTATVTQTGTAGGSYTAPTGVSITAASGAINLATSTPGTYTITYSFSSGGCSNTTTASITINALPVATIAYTAVPYCKTGVASVTQTGQTGGTYTAPAGVSITPATGDINLTASTAGTYLITYTFSNGTCSTTATTSITINALPTAVISYAGSPYCATGTATPTQTGQAGGTYTAPTGVSITAATGLINLATSMPGTYTITYSYTNGTCSNTTTASVTIKAIPTAAIAYTATPYCKTGAAAVTQTGTTGGTYAASPAGLSITAATGAINLAASTAGTYTVTYSFTSGGCSGTTTASITVNALPTATIAYAGTPYCATGIASATLTGTTGGTYTAPAAVVINASTGDIDLVASTAGTYTITYSFTNGTCSSTATTSITITALPTATISYPASPYCATGTVTPTRTGTAGGTYTAPTGVSITAATGVINLAASTPGTYTITYSFISGACSNTTTTSIIINALPTATIAYSGTPYCATGIATPTQTGTTGGTYSAPAAVSITAATGAINLAASTAGTYTITYSFTGGGCSGTATTSITITALPTATIAYSGTPFCATGTVTPTQTGTAGGTYTAPAGVSITAATGVINLAGSTAGTYTITYSFTSGACSNTATTSVTIKALPTATIAYSGSPYCATGTATVTQSGTAGGTYTAPAGVSITAATGAINLATSTAGTYTITYTFTSGGCSNTATASITINALPTAAISYTGSPFCATGTVTPTQSGQTGGTYSAPAGLSIASATGIINLAASTAGTYTITYSFGNGTCTNTTTTSVTVTALPTATIAYSGSPYCATGTATPTRTGTAGGTYAAAAGVSITAGTGVINLAASTPGTYTITYSFTVGTCSNTATASITINALPTATIAYSGSPYCATGTATPTQTGTAGGTYTAPAGVSIIAGTGVINLLTSTAGTYTVTYSFSSGGCSNTATTSITITALPTATIAYSGTPFCATGTASVTQTGTTGGTYTAPAGVSIIPATGAINLAASTPGTYTITYSFTAGACSNTATTSITINALPAATISYSGSPYCATGTATVTRTGTAGGTYSAPAGVSIIAGTGVINLGASTPGTYTITYSFSNGTCSNTATTSITINALPTAVISYAGSPYCATGSATPTQTGQTGGAYSAPAGVSIIAGTGVINLGTSTPGTYTITYSFGNGTCTNTTTTSITITALPTATIAYGGSPYCATGTASPTQTGTTGGSYSAPTGVSITAGTGVINLATSTPGTYTITYSFTSGACSNTATASITITALPTATIAYSGSPYCATGTATPTQTGTAGGSYSAPAGVSITAGTGLINLGTSTPGTYTITYSFTSGGCSNTATTSMTITALPTATIAYGGSPYCLTGTGTPTQTGTTGGTYTAPAGVSIAAGTGAINLVASTPGTYTITYSFTAGSCSNTATTSITINALPVATIAYGGSPYCATGNATPTQTGTTGGTYSAPTGVSITSGTGAINLGTSTPGTYTVTYSFSNGTCSSTTTTGITINALPTAVISYNGSPYCATGNATPTQTGQAGGSYSAPAGVSITAATGVINLGTSTAGTYTITYSFGNGTCNNTTTASVTIAALPTATIAYAGSPYCASGTASVTQTGTTGGTYSAPTGVSIIAGTGAINLAASTPGIYTITYSFTSGACSNTATTSINIITAPSVVITNPAAACSPSTVDLTAAAVTSGSTPGLTYTYFTDAGATTTLTNPNAVATSGTYYIKGSAGSGCFDIKSVTVVVNAKPTVVTTNPAAVCAPLTVDLTAGSVTTGSTTGLTYTYFTDAGGTTVLTNANAVTASGTYYVKGTNASGCSDIKSVVVTINALPTATIAYISSPYCATGTATITQTGTAGGTYSAPTGVSIIAGTGAINLGTSTPGTYTVTYSFSNGTCSNTATTSITINALPTAVISYSGSPYCATGIATVTQTGQTGGTYSAPAGVSIIAATGNINLLTSTAGTYTITYSFGNGTCTNTTTTSITITALPMATIAYGGSPYCATGIATPTQTGTTGGTYSAPTGVSITTGTGAINLVTSTPGTYTITYSFTVGACSNTATASITINALPTATIAYGGSPYCATGTATPTLTGTTGGIYSAPAGVSIIAGTGAINLSTSTPGTYTINYSFTSGGCSGTTTASITINALPTATIAYGGSPYCATGTAAPSQTGTTGGTYAAPTGVSITAGTGAIDLATSTPGTYTITYSFTSGACSNTATASVTINALPAATISYSGTPYCATGTATPTQTGTAGGTYSAPAGVSIIAGTGAINLGTSTPGTYTVTYSFSNGTCSSTTTTGITINALPTAVISYNGSPYCATGNATPTQTGQAGGTYSAPAGVFITAATGVIDLAASTAGTYTVTYSFGNGTCNNTTTASITITALPTATIAYAGSPYCATGNATVTQTGTTGGTYSAPTGVSITAGTGTINLATSTPGTYTITYSFTSGACSNTATTSINIITAPSVVITNPPAACSPSTVDLTAASVTTGSTPGLTYTYYTNAGATTVLTNPNAVATSGTYYIKGSAGSGCSDIKPVIVVVNAKPTVVITNPSAICAPGTVDITNASITTGSTGSLTYTYYTDAAATTILTNPTAVAASGTYYVKGTNASGCSDIQPVVVIINALPAASISYSGSPYCATGNATITQTGTTGGTYTAPAAVSITAATGLINLAASTPGTYTVTYSFSNGTCSNTATTSITINALPTAVISYAGSPYCATGIATVMQSGQTGGTYSAPAGVSITAATGDINLAGSTAGTYTITYSFGNGTCTNTTTTSITITALPTATIAYGGSPYCATGTATPTQTGTTGGSYSAPTGVSITAGTGAINLASSTPGTYTITYSFTSGACSNTTTASITITALPTATIAYGGSPYCATGIATPTQTGTTGGTYSAPAGVSITAGTGAINLGTSTPGTYTITYGFSSGACSSTATTSITITALPTATISYTGTPFCATGTATPTQTGTAGGTYSAPAGVSIAAGTGVINLATSTAGTYTITYSFTAGACSNTTTTSITINALPTATIAYSGSPYCATGTATPTQTGVTGGTYSAPTGVSIIAGTGAINLGTSTPGTYTVTYSFSNGTCSSTTTANITINALPTAIISYAGSPYCATGNAMPTQTGQTGGTYSAPTGVSITAATGVINLGASTAGTFTITYSFGNGTCNNTTTASVTINALPAATIAYAGSPYCANGNATVSQTGQTGGTYAATPAGLSLNASTGAVNLATSTAGTYTVTYSFTNGTCSNTTTASINIITTPSVAITNPAPACSPSTVDLTAAAVTAGSTPGLTYTYFTDAGATTVLTNPNAVATSGTYYIKGSAGSGCFDIKSVTVTVNSKPTVVTTSPAAVCAPGTVDLTASSVTTGSTTGLTYTYFTNPGGTTVLTNPNAVGTSGTYYIVGTTAAGCSDIKPVVVTINALPAATIAYGGSPYCATGSATPTQTGTAGGTYTAPAGVSITAATGAINLGTSTPGTYTVTYTFSNGTCSNTTTTSVTINALPTANIVYAASPYCATGMATVTQTGQTGGTYSAPTGVSITAATGDIDLTASTAGTYTITYSFGNGTCNNTTTASITINALPTATIVYSGTPYCATGNATITQTGQTGGTYAATPTGLSLNTSTGAVNLAISTPGAYTVTYSFTNGTCSNTATTSINIITSPVVAITNPAAVCAPSTVDLTAAAVTVGSTAGLTYTYFTDAAATLVLANANAVATSGTYYIKGTTAAGCFSVQPVLVTINPKPAVVITNPPPVCPPSTIDLTTAAVTNGSTTGLTYTYFTDAGGTTVLANANAVAVAGTYYIMGTTALGCSDIKPVLVTFNALPSATIAYAGSPYCETGTATVTQTGQTGGTYTAPAGVVIDAATGDITLTTSAPGGPYTISYTFSNGTCSNTTTTTITINALPTATINYSGSPYCATGMATVTQNGQTGGTYSALPAGLSIDGTTGAIDLVSSTSGINYTVTYSFGNGTCVNTTTTSVFINPLPTVTITNPAAVCAPGTVDLTAAAVTAGSTAGLTFTYFTDAAATATLANANAVAVSGTYYIKGTAASGCSSIQYVVVTVNPKPSVVITNPAAVCSPATVDITAATVTAGSTTGLTYTYYTDAAGTTALTNPNAIAAAGTYYIQGATVSGCTDIQPVVVTINPKPTVVITNPAAICPPSTIDLTAANVTTGSTPGLTYTYFTDAAGTLALTNPNAVTVAGTYYIVGTTALGCSDIEPVVVTFNALPTATISYDGSPYCESGTATVTQTGQTGGFYTAPFGVAIDGTTGNINLSTSPSGTFIITYTSSNGTCSGSTTATIVINALPTATINYAGSPYCATGMASVSESGQTGGTYSSTTGLIIDGPSGTVDLANSTAGTYTVTYSFGNGTCTNTTTTLITIKALPVSTIAYAGSPYCMNGTATATITGTSGGTFSSSPATLSLNTTTGDIDLGASPEGTYTVTYNVTSGACSYTTTTTVVIKNPTLVVNNPTAVCFPGTVDLTDPAITAGSAPGMSISYYTDNAGTIPVTNPTAVTGGNYFLRGVNTSTGCSSDIQPVVVTIYTKPTVTASSSETDICKGVTITLTASSPGNTIDWPGLGSGSPIMATPADSTIYLAVATDANGCKDTASVPVAVNPFRLTLTANPDPVLAGTNTTFTTTGNFAYNVLSWSPDAFFSDQTATSQNIVVKDTSKSFTVIAQSIDGCLDTATLYVVVDANLKDFFIPNAFSPNNDGNNDVFKVYGSSVKAVTMRIYNQWGQLVYESENATAGWDGTWKGRPQAVGVYVYVAQVTFYNNVVMKRKGTINLIR